METTVAVATAAATDGMAEAAAADTPAADKVVGKAVEDVAAVAATSTPTARRSWSGCVARPAGACSR